MTTAARTLAEFAVDPRYETPNDPSIGAVCANTAIEEYPGAIVIPLFD